MALRAFDLTDLARSLGSGHTHGNSGVEVNGENAKFCTVTQQTEANACFQEITDAFNSCTGRGVLNATYVTGIVKNMTECIPICFYGNGSAVAIEVPEEQHLAEDVLAVDGFYRLNDTFKFCQTTIPTACSQALPSGYNCTTTVTELFEEHLAEFNGAGVTGASALTVVMVLASTFLS